MNTRVITLDGPTLVSALTMTVRIKRMRQVQLRLALARWLIRLAAGVAGMGIEILDESA